MLVGGSLDDENEIKSKEETTSAGSLDDENELKSKEDISSSGILEDENELKSKEETSSAGGNKKSRSVPFSYVNVFGNRKEFAPIFLAGTYVDTVHSTPTLELRYFNYRVPSFNIGECFLLDFNGDVLVILPVYTRDKSTVSAFRVFKADFDRNELVKIDRIGEYAIFVGPKSSFCLPAEEIGCNGNTIYYSNIWKAFDLVKMQWYADPNFEKDNFNERWHWILPSGYPFDYDLHCSKSQKKELKVISMKKDFTYSL